MPKIVPVLMMVLAAGAGTFSAQADIYAYRDEHGVLNYTNMRPNDDRYQVRVIYKDKPAPVATVHFHGNDDAPLNLPARFNAIVDEAADHYAVDKALVQAVIYAESAFKVRAVSVKGAMGLMQLMPETAQRYGVHDLFDPRQNIMGGVRYLRDLLDDFGNNLRLALAAYNAGENSVLRYGGVPPFPETIDYVERVLKFRSAYRNRS